MTTTPPETNTNIADIQAKLSNSSNRWDAIDFKFNLMLSMFGITEGDLNSAALTGPIVWPCNGKFPQSSTGDLPDKSKPSVFTCEFMAKLNDMTFSESEEEAKESPKKRPKY